MTFQKRKTSSFSNRCKRCPLKAVAKNNWCKEGARGCMRADLLHENCG